MKTLVAPVAVPQADPGLSAKPPLRSAEVFLHSLEERLAPLYERLAAHPLYASMRSLEDLHCFMQTHVFAVWDFMSLLKALQRGLTCVEVPWLPSRFPEARRLINEIVLGEESDLYQGEAVSHFELYRRAMQQCGASTEAIDSFLNQLERGEETERALWQLRLPLTAQRFVQSTFTFIASGELHIVAAAFTFGREDLIPGVFKAFIRDQDEQLSGKLALFRWYLDRHIEVDGEEHGPMSLRMVSGLCGSDPVKWQQAETAAVQAIEARLTFWDAILASLPSTAGK